MVIRLEISEEQELWLCKFLKTINCQCKDIQTSGWTRVHSLIWKSIGVRAASVLADIPYLREAPVVLQTWMWAAWSVQTLLKLPRFQERLRYLIELLLTCPFILCASAIVAHVLAATGGQYSLSDTFHFTLAYSAAAICYITNLLPTLRPSLMPKNFSFQRFTTVLARQEVGNNFFPASTYPDQRPPPQLNNSPRQTPSPLPNAQRFMQALNPPLAQKPSLPDSVPPSQCPTTFPDSF